MTLPDAAEPATDVAADVAATDDGRRQRAERNRAAVVDALLSLFDEGMVRPGAADIAARAGVSTRSVFRHFEDLEALTRVAVDRQWARVRHLYAPPDPAGDVATRAGALVDQRLRLYDAVIGVARAAIVMSLSSPTLATAVEDRRRLMADQVAALFAPELERVADPVERHDLAAVLAATAGLEHVDQLRAQAGLTPERARTVLVRVLVALLAPGGPGAAAAP
ncbi:MAG TPA: TetR/AcrR family transcriptional regulator [Acidimicrobiales bacterium]